MWAPDGLRMLESAVRAILVIAVCLLEAIPATVDWQVRTTTETRYVLRDGETVGARTVKLAAARNAWRAATAD
jgi:hypothetical protein